MTTGQSSGTFLIFPTPSPSIVPQKRPFDDQNTPEGEPQAQQPYGRYQYRPLDASKHEVRLLSLDPSPNAKEPITGTILHVSLDSLPGPQTTPRSAFGATRAAAYSYTALSYAWGDPWAPGGADTLVAGGALRVTANLAAALRRLCGSEATPARSLWWVDALCINQADVAERNAQVALMRRIYASAARVQVWLGGDADGSGAAMGLVRNLAEPAAAWTRASRDRACVHRGRREAEQSRVPCGLVSARVVGPCVGASGGGAGKSAQLPVRGGDLHARGADGRRDLAARELAAPEAGVEAERHGPRAEAGPDELRSASRRVQGAAAKSGRGSHYIDLCTLLLHSRACKATDLHDKVFGVLGLADPRVYRLTVNYGLPVQDVYRLAATAIITKTNTLNILSAAQNVDKLHSLPSWAPNLSDPWKAQPFPASTTGFGFAISHSLASKPAQYHLSRSDKVLTVKGRVYGRIARLGAPAAKGTYSNAELAQILAACTEFARSVLATKQQAPGAGGLFGAPATFSFGVDSGDFATPEERCVARLLLVPLKSQTTAKGVFGFGQGPPEADPAYARSLLAPEAWTETRIGNLALREGMRRYGAGRTVGHCDDGAHGGVGLFPDEAREGDVVVYLYGAVYPYVLRKMMTVGYLLVGDASQFSCFHSTRVSVNYWPYGDC